MLYLFPCVPFYILPIRFCFYIFSSAWSLLLTNQLPQNHSCLVQVFLVSSVSLCLVFCYFSVCQVISSVSVPDCESIPLFFVFCDFVNCFGLLLIEYFWFHMPCMLITGNIFCFEFILHVCLLFLCMVHLLSPPTQQPAPCDTVDTYRCSNAKFL